MPIIKLKAPFKYSPDGITVIDYPAGEADIDALGAEIAGSLGLVEGGPVLTVEFRVHMVRSEHHSAAGTDGAHA